MGQGPSPLQASPPPTPPHQPLEGLCRPWRCGGGSGAAAAALSCLRLVEGEAHRRCRLWVRGRHSPLHKIIKLSAIKVCHGYLIHCGVLQAACREMPKGTSREAASSVQHTVYSMHRTVLHLVVWVEGAPPADAPRCFLVGPAGRAAVEERGMWRMMVCAACKPSVFWHSRHGTPAQQGAEARGQG